MMRYVTAIWSSLLVLLLLTSSGFSANDDLKAALAAQYDIPEEDIDLFPEIHNQLINLQQLDRANIDLPGLDNNGDNLRRDDEVAFNLVDAGDFSLPQDIISVDLDSDGDSDLLAKSASDDHLYWWRQNADGTFTRIEIEQDFAITAFDAADIDADDDMDIIITNAAGVTIFENDGAEDFGQNLVWEDNSSGTALKVIDLDRDDDLDMIIVFPDAGMVWLENDGEGAFSLNEITADDLMDIIKVADIDGDDDWDIICDASDGADGMAMYVNGGGQDFNLQSIEDQFEVFDLAIADMDGDNELDIVGLADGNALYLWLNAGDLEFGKELINDNFGVATRLDLGDMDDDGDVDIVFNDLGNDKIGWFDNLNNGEFTQRLVMDQIDAPLVVKVVDFDNDEILDVLTVGFGSGDLYWIENTTERLYPEIDVDPTDLPFGDVQVQQTKNLTVTISNFAEDLLRVTGATIAGNNAAYFSVNFQNEIEIGAFEDADLIITYEPQATGAHSATLTIFSNDQNNPEVDVALAGTGTPSDASIEFTEIAIASNIDGAYAVFAGDIDGDGDIDFVSAASNQDRLSWWENDGNQNFQQNVIDNAFDDVRSAFVADVDTDGDMDVVAAGPGADQIIWYENDGDEAWTEHIVADGFADVKSVIVADLNGDGDMDIAAAASSADEIRWWENNGAEEFASNLVAANFDYANDVKAVDIDGDDDLDLIAVALQGDDVSWFENDGNEAFDAHLIDDNFNGAFSVNFGDIDGDGDMDVLGAASVADEVAWWENDGNQNFQKHVISNQMDGARSVQAADFDRDGDMDVVASAFSGDEVSWFDNDGNENFTRRVMNDAYDGASFIIIADLDSDVDKDVIGASYNLDELTWWENDLDPPISDIDVTPLAVDFSDVDIYDSKTLTVTISNDGDDPVTVEDIYTDDAYFTVVFAGEFDVASGEEVDVDVTFAPDVVGNYAGNLYIESNDPINDQIEVPLEGVCVIPPDPAMWERNDIIDDYQGARYIFAIDINKDEEIDIVGAAQAANEVSWWENEGEQAYNRHAITSNFSSVTSVYATDLDQDGEIDILACALDLDELSWWRNDGSETFDDDNRIVIDDAIVDPFVVKAADIDLDGDIDVYVCTSSANEGAVAWYENDGNENFDRHFIDNDVLRTHDVLAVDLDQDDDIDILAASAGLNDLIWWENDGDQNFAQHTIDGNYDDAEGVAVGDFDLDGDLDVAATAANAQEVSWYEWDQVQEDWIKHVLVQNYTNAQGISAMDFDRDDDLDIVATSRGLGDVHWWENRGGGNFIQRVIDTDFPNARRVQAVDMDFDGDSDVIVVGNNTIAWWENGLNPFVPDVTINDNNFAYGEVPIGDAGTINLEIGNVGDIRLKVKEVYVEGDYFTTDFANYFFVNVDETEIVEMYFTPEAEGDFEATLFLVTDDPDEDTLQVALTGTGIYVAVAPEVVGSLPDREFNEDFGATIVADLDTVFTDANGEELSFTTFSNEFSLTTITDGNNKLYLIPSANWNGSATVTVIADDGYDPEGGPRRDDDLDDFLAAFEAGELDGLTPSDTRLLRRAGNANQVDNSARRLRRPGDSGEEFISAWTYDRIYDLARKQKGNPMRRDLSTELEFDVTVHPVNDRPVWTNIPTTIEVTETDTIFFGIRSNDVDGDLLDLTLDAGDIAEFVTFTDSTNNRGSFRWITTFDDAGEYVLTFTAADTALQADHQVTITVLNNNRDVFWDTIIESAEASETDTIRFTISGDDPDTDDTWTVSMDMAELPETATFTDHGDKTGSFEWATTYEDSGHFTITATFADDKGSEVTADIELTVINVNRPPVWDSVPELTEGDELEDILFAVSGSDADGDELTIDIDFGDLPDAADFTDNTDGTGDFAWTTTYEDSGHYEITLSIYDYADTSTTTTTVAVYNVNRAPQFTFFPADFDITETDTIEFTLVAEDDDNDPMTITADLSELPETATFTDNEDGTADFYWITNNNDWGDYAASFTVADYMDDNTGNLAISVANLNRLPEWTDPPEDLTINEDEIFDLDFSATDPDGQNVTITMEDHGQLPEAAEFTDFGDGTANFYWDTDYLAAGEYDLTFTLADPEESWDTTITLTVINVNSPPRWDRVAEDTELDELETISFYIEGSDPFDSGEGLSLYFTGDLPQAASLTDNGDGSGDFEWATTQDDSGEYVVTFTIDDGELTADFEVTLYVNNVNRIPEWTATEDDFTVNETDTIDFVIEGADGDNDDLEITADLTEFPEGTTFTDNGDGTARFQWDTGYEDEGTYTVIFTLADYMDSVTDTLTISVDKTNRAPIWDDVPDDFGATETETVEFSVAASDLDAEDSVSLSATGLPDGAEFTDNEDGTGDFVWVTDYADSADYDITLTVTDGIEDVDYTFTLTIANLNRAPVWDIEAVDQHSDEISTVAFTIEGSDPDGEAVAISMDTDLPEAATLTDNGDGTADFEWDVTYDDAGEYYAEFTITDGRLEATHQISIVIDNVNRYPVWQVQPTDQTMSETETFEFTISATDPDGEQLTITMDSDDLPEAASFTDNTDGTGDFSWETTYDDEGVYTATFTVTDGDLAIDETIQIDVDKTNREPVWDDTPDDFSATETDRVQFSVTAHDPDPEDDVTITISGKPDDATFVDNTDGTADFDWTTTYLDSADYVMTITVSDGVADTDYTFTLTIDNLNRSPEWTVEAADVTVNETDEISFTIEGFDPDPEDDLAISAAGIPEGADFTDNGDGTADFAWTTTYTDSGNYDLTFTLTDGRLSVESDVHLTVINVNRAPVYDSFPSDPTFTELDEATFSVAASDPDGDAVSLYLLESEFPEGSSFTDNGDGTAEFSWQTGYYDAGVYTAIVASSDGDLETQQLITVTIDNLNRDPEWTQESADYDVDEGDLIQFTLSIADADTDDVLTFEMSGDLPVSAKLTDNGDGTADFSWQVWYDDGTADGRDYAQTFTFFDGTTEITTDVAFTVTDIHSPPDFREFPADELIHVMESDTIDLRLTWFDREEDAFDLTFNVGTLPESASWTEHTDSTGTLYWETSHTEAGDYWCSFFLSDDTGDTITWVLDIVVDDVTLIRVPQLYTTIQRAIDRAAESDTVLVDEGEYEENISFVGKEILVLGNPEDPGSVTILGEPERHAVHFVEDETENSILQGFTITSLIDEYSHRGWGILSYRSSPVIKNCIIEECKNNAGFVEEGYAGNEAPHGAAGYLNASSAKFEDCTFRNNRATSPGAGVFNIVGNSYVEFLNCRFESNLSAYNSGAIDAEYSSISLSKCIFVENDGQVGAITIDSYQEPNPITESLFFANNSRRQANSGGIILINDGDLYLDNTTLAHNTGAVNAGVVGFDGWSGTSITAHNSIFWNNKVDNQNTNFTLAGGCELLIEYSTVEGGVDEDNDGGGNIDSDPLFADPDNGDFSLTWETYPDYDAGRSPAINAGDPDSVEDPDGTRADMGAYYFDHEPKQDVDVVASVGFDDTKVFSQSAQTLTIYNLGEEPLSISDISVTAGTPFSVQFDGSVDVDGNNGLDRMVYFFPETYGDHNATLTITSDDPNEQSVTVDLSGRGVNTEPVADGTIADFDVDEDFETFIVADLDTIFSDPLEDPLVYYAESDVEGLTAEIIDETLVQLSVSENWHGDALISIVADDEDRYGNAGRRDETNSRARTLRRAGGQSAVDMRRDLTAELDFTVTVNPVNDAPFWVDEQTDIAILEGETIEFAISGDDVDILTDDDEALSIISTIPDGADFTDNGDGSGDLLWETTAEDSGSYNLTFVLSDGDATDTTTVYIYVENVNRVPYWTTAPADIELNETESFSYTFVAVDDDNDDIVIEFASDLPEAFEFIDNTDGTATISWQTTYADSGHYAGTFTVYDYMDTITTDISVVVLNVNRVPIWDVMPEDISATELDEISFEIVAYDDDGDAIEFTMDGEVIPEDIQFTDGGSGTATFVWQTTYDDEGDYDLTFTAADYMDDIAETITISVAKLNREPEWDVAPEDLTVDELGVFDFTLVATDADGDDMTIQLAAETLPEAATFTDNGDGSADFYWETTYEDSGHYDLTFTLKDEESTQQFDIVLTVVNVNRPPVWGELPDDFAVDEDDNVEFTLTATDDDSDPLEIIIVETDLPEEATFTDNNDGTADFAWQTGYFDEGDYYVIFEVADYMDSEQFQLAISVSNVDREPELTLPDDITVDETDLIEFTVSATDPDFDVYDITLTSDNLPEAVQFTDGGENEASFYWQTTYEDSGSYSATFTFTNEFGEWSGDISIRVDNVNRVPYWTTEPADVSLDEDQTVEFTLVAVDDDNDPLTIVMTEESLPEAASFTDNEDGTAGFTWRTTFDDAGEYPLTFTLADYMDEISSDMTIYVGDVNRTPLWDDLSAGAEITIDEDNTLSFTVTGHDPDGDDVRLSYSSADLPEDVEFTDNGDGTGDFEWYAGYFDAGEYTATFNIADAEFDVDIEVAITVTNVNRLPEWTIEPADQEVAENSELTFTIAASDPDLESLSFTMTSESLPEDVTFSDLENDTATFVWTPDFESAGDYDVTFSMTDGIDEVSADITITVTNTNRLPEWTTAPEDVTVAETETFDFLVEASDPDGQAISFSIEFEDLPEDATFTDNEDGTASFKWQTTYADSGSYAVTFVMNDSEEDVTADITLTVSNVNRPPVWEVEARDVESAENDEILFTIEASDPDGDPVSFTMESDNLPDYAYFTDNDDNTADFEWLPTYDDSGDYTATFFATDGDLVIETEITLVIDHVNRPPEVVYDLGEVAVDEDYGEYTIADLDTIIVDPDGDEVSFSVESGVEEVTLMLDDDNVLSLISDENYNGESVVTITADDGVEQQRVSVRTLRGAGSRMAADMRRDDNIESDFDLIITPVNDAPVWTSYPDEELHYEEGDLIEFTLKAFDIDGDELEAVILGGNVPRTARLTADEETAALWLFSWQVGDQEGGDYTVEFAMSDGDEIVYLTLDIFVKIVVPLEHFSVVEATETMHTLTISDVMDENGTVETGWEIGVFSSVNYRQIAGARPWIAEQQTVIEVYGDDPETEEIEGLTEDEPFRFIVWDYGANVEYDFSAEFTEGPDTWTDGGESTVELTLIPLIEYHISLHEGWNLMSLPIDPRGYDKTEGDLIVPGIKEMAIAFRGDDGSQRLLHQKDGAGQFYLPSIPYNNIPYWNRYNGYQVKVTEAMDIYWLGMPIPYDTPIPLEEGWNLVPYYPDYDLSMNDPDFTAISSIVDEVIIAKDELGNFALPEFGYNDMDPWQQGSSYFIKTSADVKLVYPGEQERVAATHIAHQRPQHWSAIRSGETSMSVMLTEVNGTQLLSGVEIGAFDVDGNLLGSGLARNGMAGLAVWSDQSTATGVAALENGERFNLRMYDPQTNHEWALDADQVLRGGGLKFAGNDYTVITASTHADLPTEFYLSAAYPNPFNGLTRFDYGLRDAAAVSIMVYDLTGKQVAVIESAEQQAGSYSAIWNASAMPSGVYVVRMTAADKTFIRKVLLMK